MLLWTSSSSDRRASWHFPAHLGCARKRSAKLAGIYRLLRVACFAALCASSLVLSSGISRAEDVDFSVYHRAANYCRGDVPRPMALSPDKRILCFDGPLLFGHDYAPVKVLEDGGLFVVRSPGGYAAPAIALADLVRDRHATVVVYDNCFSACASYLIFASAKTFILKDALVAWHLTPDPAWCPLLAWPRDAGPKRLDKVPCRKAYSEEEDGEKIRRRLDYKFYEGRAIDRLFEGPPESFTIRRKLQHLFEDTEKYPDVMWTWNPRYYADAFLAEIVYEAYPKSQAEVDTMVARLNTIHVLYDP